MRREKADSSLTTPKLHPKEQRPFFEDPGLKKALGGEVGSEMSNCQYAIFDLNATRRAMQRRIEAINPSITPLQEDALGKETTTI